MRRICSEKLREILALDAPVEEWAKEEGIADEEIRERIRTAVDEIYAQKREKYSPEVMAQIEKAVLLQTLDHLWREHIITVEHLAPGDSSCAATASATP